MSIGARPGKRAQWRVSGGPGGRGNGGGPVRSRARRDWRWRAADMPAVPGKPPILPSQAGRPDGRPAPDWVTDERPRQDRRNRCGAGTLWLRILPEYLGAMEARIAMTGNQRLRAGVLALAIVIGIATIVGSLLLGASPLTVIGAALAVASLALSRARLAGEIGGRGAAGPSSGQGLAGGTPGCSRA